MQYAAQFLAELRSCQIDGQDYTAMEIQEFIPVFSPDDTQNGVLAIIADTDSVGYIQVAEFGGKFYVSEFTDDYDLSFPDEKLYYLGLRSYFRKVKESSFENIITQEICTISDLPARKNSVICSSRSVKPYQNCCIYPKSRNDFHSSANRKFLCCNQCCHGSAVLKRAQRIQ